MGVVPLRVRKRPVEVEAMVWPGGEAEAAPVLDWLFTIGSEGRYRAETILPAPVLPNADGATPQKVRIMPEHISIETLEGIMHASPGDYIVKGVHGEFYPVKPAIFAETYDIITTGETAS